MNTIIKYLDSLEVKNEWQSKIRKDVLIIKHKNIILRIFKLESYKYNNYCISPNIEGSWQLSKEYKTVKTVKEAIKEILELKEG